MRYAAHENGEASSAYVPALTGECQVIAGFSALQIFFLFFYKKKICERHLSRSSGLGKIPPLPFQRRRPPEISEIPVN